MKMKKILSTAIILLLSSIIFCQTNPVQQKAIVLKRMIEKKHYSPRLTDDNYSADVFKSILQEADPRRLLFTNAEYQDLYLFKYKLDDEINGKGWGFLDKFSFLYKNTLNRADSIINLIFKKPFDYNQPEILTQGRTVDTFNFSKDIPSLINRWSRYLKYQLLDDVYDKVNSDSIKKTSLKEGLTLFETKAKEKVRKTELKGLKKILDHPAGYASVVTELYLNAIATSFDPHTNYFSPQGKEQFQAELSTEGYFFGIVLEENANGQVAVKQLTPGGSAWKSGQINKGDELLSLLWEGKEIQDMEGASVEEAYEILDQSNHERLLFRFKKADGTTSNILLQKEKSDNEENIVKGFVLKGEKKIGYILLPGFYTEWENEKGSSCANDVAREILKLKKENIEGLILDVRYNGGGSIGEAMEMIGIFIEEGPLTVVKEKSGKLITLKDPNRGTIYDGSMILMVNGQSASASEMLAASLQDYNRAIIVGSHTYGKATMQEMLLMDTSFTRQINGDEKGDITKITTGKLYRLNGKTAQLHGVTPDIPLPDAFDGLEIGEKFANNPLPADTVKRNNYYKPLPYLPVNKLAANSVVRITSHPDFQIIRKIIAEQQKIMQSASITIPLKAELFEKWVKEQELNLEVMKGAGKNGDKFTAENHAADKRLIQGNEYGKEINNLWLKHLPADIYIQEAFLVLIDLINLQKTTSQN